LKDEVPKWFSLIIKLLAPLRIVSKAGAINGRLTSYEPGPGKERGYFLCLGFLADIDPKGA